MFEDSKFKKRGYDVSTEGTIRVPSFDLPLSAALSDQYRGMLAAILSAGFRFDIPDSEDYESESEFVEAVDRFRGELDAKMLPLSIALEQQYPVKIEARSVGGVRIEEFSPVEGVDNHRVLINLHGGAFLCGRLHLSRVESIPVAHLGKYRIISVDYRQGYEHKFPAACEDVIKVYKELLEAYMPGQIGIYGTSAGGMLAAQTAAMMIELGIPLPGALGIFCAGTGGSGDGDYFSSIGTADPKLPLRRMAQTSGARYGYFSETKSNDYLVNPVISSIAFRSKFPPTLLITGLRAFDLSPAISLHRALVQADVDASLHVFDGVGHGFFYDAMMPESMDAYQTIVKFFRSKLMV